MRIKGRALCVGRMAPDLADHYEAALPFLARINKMNIVKKAIKLRKG